MVGIDKKTLKNAVSAWLNENFDESVQRLGNRYSFGQVILKEPDERRHLQATDFVTYEGMSVWRLDKPVPDETIVAAIQLEALLDREGLVQVLQEQDDNTGLGSFVVDARGDLNRDIDQPAPPTPAPVSNDSLDVIIIVAIIIAVLAFCLLAFALFMAWRHNNQATSSKAAHTGSATDNGSPIGTTKPPSEIAGGGGTGVESVISEDISTSLTAYYQGLAQADPYLKPDKKKETLNDAASISSMESYGYSLDGYASSIAPDAKKQAKK